jgi:hypothetical protein
MSTEQRHERNRGKSAGASPPCADYSPRPLDKNNDVQPLEVEADRGYGDALSVS